MRRPVLPSSGQAYDEINLVRFSKAGNKRCPVSGAAMKFVRGEVARTPDYALRSVIRSQARQAKVRPALCCALSEKTLISMQLQLPYSACWNLH